MSCFFCLSDYYRKNNAAKKRRDKNFLSFVVAHSQSYTFKFANDQLEMVVKEMSANKKKVKNAAEKTGEAVGKGIKKGAKAVNDLGKGIKKGLKKRE